MSWIKEIKYAQATGRLKKIYDRIKGPNDYIDNVLTVHSLRPHSLMGHMTLYKSVLHNVKNELPKWYLEALGVYTSALNQCQYCVEHHSEGMKRLINNREKSHAILNAIQTDHLESVFEGKYLVGISYARQLTLALSSVSESDIDQLRASGLSDGEILEINQVVSYFNYVNRMVVGLGVNTDGDIIGLSPGDGEDPENWTHE